MTAPDPNAPQEWLCAACNLPLQPKQIRVSYLGSAYPVDLLTCPKCGQIFVPEELAIGKMVEVEQALEDK